MTAGATAPRRRVTRWDGPDSLHDDGKGYRANPTYTQPPATPDKPMSNSPTALVPLAAPAGRADANEESTEHHHRRCYADYSREQLVSAIENARAEILIARNAADSATAWGNYNVSVLRLALGAYGDAAQAAIMAGDDRLVDDSAS
jgi:hypothetical protein